MPVGDSNQSDARRFRELAEKLRAARDRYSELLAALRRTHPETITVSAWTKLRAGFLELFEEARLRSEAQAKLFDTLAKEVGFSDALTELLAEVDDERLYPRCSDPDSVRDPEI